MSDSVGHSHSGETAKAHPNANWRSLFKFTSRSHYLLVSIAMILTVSTAVIYPVFALYLGKLFQSFTLHGDGQISGSQLLERVRSDVSMLLIIGVASWALNACFLFAWVSFAELQVKYARHRLFEDLLGQEIMWFDMRKEGTGAFLSHAQKQMRELQIAAGQPLGSVIQYTIRVLATLALALYLSWKVTLVTISVVPISALFISFLSSRMKPVVRAQQSELSGASKLTHDAFSAIEVVKCLNGQTSTYYQFVSYIRAAAKWYMQLAFLTAIQMAWTRFASFAMFVQGFWYGSTLVQSEELTPGQVLSTFWACLIAVQSIEMGINYLPALERGKLAGATLNSYLQGSRPKVSSPGRSRNCCPDPSKGDVVLKDVSFAYPFQPDRPVLRSANICFPAGKTTFVVGRSGAGKSTLSNLLLQFYFPTSGGILIDNIPIQAIDTLWIRNNITLVQQNSFLFNETLSENIALGGCNDGSDIKEKIEICVEAANLQETVNRLPNGLQTVVGAGGNLLSGGQKQRAAIARARMKDSPILILDESTSALDFKNKMTVMNAIRKWRQGKTTIFITHDTTNILSDDLTYVLEAGQVVDSGFKCELMERNETIFSGSDDTIPEVDRSDTLSIHSTSDMPSMPHRLSYDPWFPSFGNVTLTSPTESEFLLSSRDDRHDQVHLTSPTESTVDSPTTRKPPFARHRSIHYSQVDIDTGTIEEKNFVSFRNEVLKQLRSWKSNVRTSRLEGLQLPESIDHHRILPVHRTLLTIPTILNVKQRILLVTALVCACVHAASSPIFSYLLSQLFQTFYVGGDRQAVARKWSLAVLGLALGDSAVTFAMHYLLEYCSQVWIDELRQKALKRTLDQPRSWFEEEQNEPLQLAVCLDQNAEEIRNLVGRFASLLMIAVTTAIIAITWSLVLCWKLTLVSLACAPVLYGISKGLEIVSRRWESRTNDLNEMVAAIFSDTFTDIRTVRAFTLEHRFRLKHTIVLRKALIIGLKRGGYTGIFYGLAQSAVIFASALIFYYGAVLVFAGTWSVTDIITVFAMILFSVGYAVTVISWIPQLNSAYDTATRLIHLSRLPYATSFEHVGKMRVFDPLPICFSNVRFRYPRRPQAVILHNFSLTIPENSCFALVGSSGSGKSTITSLLLGLHASSRLQHGPPTITLGGVDIGQLHLPTLRSMIALVPQQPRLFADTIRANITYGLDPCSRLNSKQNVEAAAQAAGIDEFIQSLPEGYSTLVGSGGLDLSGGQAQRVVIARALVRHPSVLILDEATSNLDPESAETIRRSVQKLVAARQGLTVVMITHTREMMAMADTVVVIDHGTVVEQGPYRVLLQRSGGKLREMMTGGEMFEA